MLAALASAPGLRAQAMLTFTTPVNITTDTNVSTVGTFVSAFDAGSATATTVNGVTFAATSGSTFMTSMTFGSGPGSLTFTPASGDAFNGYGGAGNTPSGGAA